MKKLEQPVLFEAWETSTGALELFPAVWNAAQNLAHPDQSIRRLALKCLVEMNAPRLSPLIAYLVATRLMDPDIEIRKEVVRILGALLILDDEGRETESTIRQYVAAFLSQMRTRSVFSLLQAAGEASELDEMVAKILNSCPYAGEHLADIFNDRKVPISVRKKAVYFTGQVGFLDTIPDLERLEARLAARVTGQQTMSFAGTGLADESELVPLVEQALLLLREP